MVPVSSGVFEAVPDLDVQSECCDVVNEHDVDRCGPPAAGRQDGVNVP